MKLALGTVQFGSGYGAFGTGQKVPESEVAAILNRAQTASVDLLDTARAYGEAETVLGAERAAERFRIVTKCPKLSGTADPAAELLAHFETSCSFLGTNRIAGYLLHSALDLEHRGVLAALEGLVRQGRVERFGVSVYSFEEAESLCARYPLNLVQLPANVLVPWFRNGGLPPAVEVHARSAFLQGFLLHDPERLPDRFRRWRSTLEMFRARAAALNLTPLQAALAPLLHSRYICRVVVGVDSLAQAEELLSAATTGPADLGDFPDVSTELTDPRAWEEKRS